MQLTGILILLPLLILSAAGNTPRNVIGAVRDSHFERLWSREPISDLSQQHSFRIQLYECNLAQLQRIFEQVSDPSHENYGKYLTSKEINDLVSCGEEIPNQIIDWLQEHQISKDQIKVRSSHIRVTAPLSTIETLFSTEMHSYTHSVTGNTFNRVYGHFSIPSHLANHVKFVSGISEFLDSHSTSYSTEKYSDPGKHNKLPNNMDLSDPMVTPKDLRKLYNIPEHLVGGSQPTNAQGIAAFDDLFTEDDLCQAQYLFSPSPERSQSASISFYGVLNESDVVESDLDMQYVTMMGVGVDTVFSNHPDGEWILDWAQEAVEYTDENGPWMWSLSYGFPEQAQCDLVACTNVGYDWSSYINQTETQLMKLGTMGVSVLVSSGDDGTPGFGINCPLDPFAFSCSDGFVCQCVSTVFSYTQDNETKTCFIPLGATGDGAALIPGATGWDCGFLFETDASNYSDAAAAFNLFMNAGNYTSDECPTSYVEGSDTEMPLFKTTCECSDIPLVQKTYTPEELGTGSNKSIEISFQGYVYKPEYGPFFTPDYPASSAYVTSVGATQMTIESGMCRFDQFTLGTMDSPSESISNQKMGAFDAGGGFSIGITRPKWQNQAVDTYLAHPELLPPSYAFDNSTRAYPDIAFNGHKYVVTEQLTITTVDGTSASSPALAGSLSLLNEMLIAHGKPTLGFLNPLLYSMAVKKPETITKIGASTFADIIHIDSNRCSRFGCCETGFYTISTQAANSDLRWDPITGLGTPNVALIEKYLQELHGIPCSDGGLQELHGISSSDGGNSNSSGGSSDKVSETAAILIGVGSFSVGVLGAVVFFYLYQKRVRNEDYVELNREQV